MTGAFRIEALGPNHDRAAFACGVKALDAYLEKQVGQDVRRRVGACYVAIEESSGKLAGYYTLAAGGIPLGDLAEPLIRKLPRYPSVPVARIGRLAIDQVFQGRKLGAALLADAALRALRSEAAVFALVVDAKDEAAEAFYRHHGFHAFGPRSRQLIVPLGSFARVA